jgi:putative aldouronate transport system substrate-binding protein
MATELNKQGLLTYEQCGAIITDTMVESLAQLQKMELETFTRIITGDAPVDEFDNFVKSWNDLGGAKITEEINSFYGL